jgi:DNA-binding NarL/FixJ family response regulator
MLALAAAARRCLPRTGFETAPPSVPFQPLRNAVRIVSALRPDTRVPAALTPALRSVLRLLLDGETHEQMALHRGSSKRTIANQLGALFQILQASGRAELLARLSRAEVERFAFRARVSTLAAPVVLITATSGQLPATG